MQIVWIILFGLLGLAVGGGLNIVADRMPRRVPLWQGRPACESCDTLWELREIIPVYGYLAMAGRCPHCGASLGRRVLLTPIVTAVVFAWLAWYRGPGFELLADSVYSAFLIVIGVIDLEHKLILNRVVFPAIWTAVGLMVVRMLLHQPRFLHTGYWLAAGWASGQPPATIGALSQGAGALVAFGIFFALYLISPRGMGDGDVRLAALGGFITGFPGALMVVIGAIFLAGIVSALLLVTRRVTRKTAIPFAPFLVIATWVVMLWGDGWLLTYIYG